MELFDLSRALPRVCVYLADYGLIGGSRDTQDELYFKHLGKKLDSSYTKNKL